MKSPDTPPQQEDFAALVGIDWSDEKHDLCLMETENRQMESAILQQTPEAIDEWVAQLRARFYGRPVAICLEQSKGALVYALMKYDFLVLFPINPARLARYREAMTSSGAKDDPTDAHLLLDYLDRHRQQLSAWRPDDVDTRQIGLLVVARRKAVDLRKRLTNRLKDELKYYFPQAIKLVGGVLRTRLACDFLLKWSTLEKLQRAKPQTVRKFYYGHNCRRGDKIEERIEQIAQALPLTTDRAIVESSALTVEMLARQIRALLPAIEAYDEKLAELMTKHPDAAIFNGVPGAGDVMAPRLLAAFGTDRDKIQTAEVMQNLTGIAPVTKRSGKWCTVHRRWGCSKFLRQTFHEFAGHSIAYSAWSKAYYQLQRDKGKGHHTAVRALAFKWIRILFRCWQDRKPYDEATYLEALRRRAAPLLRYLELTPIAACV
ncbi:MAG: IS110 family transposase [Planctomycetes bacterium]|nr:IS110 family transposase [Planctomycetota bacterium]